jgi:hypothetical protein
LTAAPGYWMHETSGVLRPAILAYLDGRTLSTADVAAIRAYLRQWIEPDVWTGADIEALRAGIDRLHDRAAINAWLTCALVAGIDPL